MLWLEEPTHVSLCAFYTLNVEQICAVEILAEGVDRFVFARIQMHHEI